MEEMKKEPKQNEYGNFTQALKKVLQVSHAEMRAKLEAEKKQKQSKEPKK